MNRMNVFARSEDGIEVACDTSLDEGGAIIRTRFEPSIASDGTEYFVQVTAFEAELIVDYLTGETGGRDPYGDAEEIAGLVGRFHRLVNLATKAEPDYDTMGEEELRNLVKHLAPRALNQAEIAAVVNALLFPSSLSADANKHVLTPLLDRLHRLTESGTPGQRTVTVATLKFDITDLSERERDVFLGAVQAQAEHMKGDDGYPDVPIVSTEVNHA